MSRYTHKTSSQAPRFKDRRSGATRIPIVTHQYETGPLGEPIPNARRTASYPTGGIVTGVPGNRPGDTREYLISPTGTAYRTA